MVPGIAFLLALAAVDPAASGENPAADDVAEAAQQELAASALQGQVVTAVVVQGVRDDGARVSARDTFGVIPGESLDLARIRLGVKRVFLTGRWANVQVAAEPTPDPRGGVVVFLRLVPDVLIAELRVRAPKGIPQDRILAAAGLQTGERFRPDRIDEAALRTRRALADLGYPRARVDVETSTTGPETRRVLLRIDPGPPVRLRRLEILGDPAMSRSELEDVLGAERGEPFDRPHLEAGLERARALLHRRRHLAVRTEVMAVQIGPDLRSADVTVRVNAGPRYRVRWVGNELLADASLRTVIDEAKIESLDAEGLARAKSAVEATYRLAGYAHAKVSVDDVPASPPLDDDAEREVRFVIEEGSRAEVTEVTVEGSRARPAAELVAEVWNVVGAAMPDQGLLQEVDVGDVDDIVSIPSGRSRDRTRAFEVSDESAELLPRPFIRRAPIYVERAFVEAARRIADLYRADGFLDVIVDGPTAEFSADGRRIHVTYRVAEGARFTVGAIRFVDGRPCAAAGDCDGLGTLSFGEFLDEVKLEPGRPASYASIAEARSVLERNLRNRGRPFARVVEGVQRVVDRPEIDVIYTMDPGPRVAIARIRIRGNERTQELVILDRVTLQAGDLYSEAEVERSRERLARLGLFSSVSIDLLDDNPTASARELLVVVKERPQFAVEVGAGASLEDGPRTFLAGEVRNILGVGLGLRGRGQLNYPRAFYDFIYDATDPNNPLARFEPVDNAFVDWGRFFEGQAVLTGELPRLYGAPFDTRLHVDTTAVREIRPAFTLNRAAVLGGVDLQPARWLHVSPQLEAEFSDFDCPKDLRFGQSCGEGSIGLTRRRDAGFIRQTTWRASASVDLRDSPVRPRAGAWITGAADLALGSGELRVDGSAQAPTAVQSDFVKLTGAVVGYVPLAPGFVWAISGRGGDLLPFSGSYVPLFKRFYLGGTGSIRGFREDAILPADDVAWPANSRLPLDSRDLALVGSRQSLGGQFFLAARSELRVAITGELELNTFVDLGELLENAEAFSPAGIAAGAGVGLRYNTPVGPFEVDLGWKVLDGQRRLPPFQSLDRMNLHLSIGYF